MSKYRVCSGPYFLAFGLNTERYGVFGHFSRCVSLADLKSQHYSLDFEEELLLTFFGSLSSFIKTLKSSSVPLPLLNIMQRRNILKIIWDALLDLIPFIQFRKRERHPWRSVTFNQVAVWSLILLKEKAVKENKNNQRKFQNSF